MIAASVVTFGIMTSAHAELRYYIDQDVLRKNEAPTLLHRAMQDIGSNPTGWSHRWCGRQMAIWVGEGPNLARDWAHYGKPAAPKPGAIGVMNGHVGVVKEIQGHLVILVSATTRARAGTARLVSEAIP